MKHALPVALLMSSLALTAPVLAGPTPASLRPGEGYVALIYDTLQPLYDVEFNFNGLDKRVEVGGRYSAGRNLVVQALPAGRYCLDRFMAAATRWTQNNRSNHCFDVEAGALVYGGNFMPRRFETPAGIYDVVLKLSDPLMMIGMIEKEHPAIWSQYRGAPERYLPDDVHNREVLTGLGDSLSDYRAYQASRGYLTLAAKLGSGHAMQLLGIQAMKGWGIKQNYIEAARWFKAGADVGDWRSAALLCIAHDLGQGVAEDPVLALEYCSRSAEREDPMGLWYLGSLLKRGRGGESDPARAAELQQKGEAEESLPAKMYWGYELKKPDGSYPDPEGAMRLAQLAVDRGLDAARGRVASYTRRGIGVPADPAAAAKLYMQAGKKGWAGGYLQAALIHARGVGLPRDAAACHALLKEYLSVGSDAAANETAWLLVTHESAEIRDGKWALGLARKAVTREPDSPARIDTLAAAYAELQRWDDAVEQQSRAIAILQQRGENEEVIKGFAERLEKYRIQQPHREKWD